MIRKEHLGRLRCGQVGWNSVKNAFNYAEPKLELRNAASRFEGGSLNLMQRSSAPRIARYFSPDPLSAR